MMLVVLRIPVLQRLVEHLQVVNVLLCTFIPTSLEVSVVVHSSFSCTNLSLSSLPVFISSFLMRPSFIFSSKYSSV